ncbi:MAG: BMP family ABC transporter substrate-binding protein [Actinomycetota bacterium]
MPSPDHRSSRPLGILRLLAVLLAFGLIAAACGDSDDDDADVAGATEETTAEADDDGGSSDEGAAAEGDFSDVSVFMILDGSADDGGWNTTHLRGLDSIEAAFPGIQTDFVESIDPGQTATNAFEDAAASGADIVIGTTYYQDDMMDVAAAYPDTIFLTWAGFETADNVGHFDGASEEGRYLDGIVAGSLSESGIIGYPVGFPFNEVNRAVNAFTLGAQTVNPDIEVQVVYLNTWFDPAVEQQAAEALVNAGADVLAHEVGAQVYATVAAANDGYVIGYTNDWSDFEPEAWASSFLYDWGVYYVEQIEAVIDGTWEPEIAFGGLEAGYITAAPYGPAVTDDILALVEEARQGIIDGTLDPFAGPIVDNEGNVVIAEGETIPFSDRINCCQWLVEGVSGSIPG